MKTLTPPVVVSKPIDKRITDMFLKDNGFPLEDHLVIFAEIGSHSHGTYVPSTDPDSIDDTDYMGFVIPPVDKLLGMYKFEHWVWQHEELDVVIYSLEKAMRLLLKGNPNIVGMLWLRNESYLRISDHGQHLMELREQFLSQRMYHSFIGYAHGQFDNMTSGAFRGYMGEKRKQLVERFGYDTKNASHLIRLLTMGIELTKGEGLNVYRTNDADMLMDIKKGKYTLDEIKSMAEKLFDEAELAKETTPLPEWPDEAYMNNILWVIHSWSILRDIENLRNNQWTLKNGTKDS